MEDLVLSIEQCKHLQELGLDMSDAKFCWYNLCDTHKDYNSNDKWVAETINKVWKLCKNPKNYKGTDVIPTYTLQEVLNKLPVFIDKEQTSKCYYTLKIDIPNGILYYEDSSVDSEYADLLHEEDWDIDLLEASYNMLCWVLENKTFKD